MNFLQISIYKFIFIFILIPVSLLGQAGKNIGLPINIQGSEEVSPAISFDGQIFIYVLKANNQTKIFECKKQEDNTWSKPNSIDAINNFGSDENIISSPCLNYDASVLYFEANFNRDSSKTDIYFSKKVNGVWGKPQSIGFPINSVNYDGQPSISANDKDLYFTRDNDESESKNCKIIYVSHKQLDGNWGKPYALPIPVNTGCEYSPKICADNKTLYFASIRHGGKGMMDLYYTKRLAQNVWIPPISLDTINSIYAENYPSMAASDNTLFFSRGVGENDNLNFSIFSYKLPIFVIPTKNVILSGKVTDSKTQKAIPANISIIDPNSSLKISNYKNNSHDGSYSFVLPKGKKYKIDFSYDKYSHKIFTYDATKIRKNISEKKDIKLYSEIKLIFNIFDNEVFKPLNGKIIISELSSNNIIECKIDKISNGRYSITLPIGKRYKISVEKDFFIPYSVKLDLTGVIQFEEFEKDIELEVKKKDFELNVTDAETNKDLEVEVVITNLNSNEVIRKTIKKDKDGKYVIKLRDGDKYNVSISPKGYSFYNTTIDLKKNRKKKNLNIKLNPLTKGRKLRLKKITFETNSAELNPSSYTELDRVVELMKVNYDMKVEISAHTDNAGSDNYNLKLSDKRAKSVVVYMLDKGVDNNNVISKGYGEKKPIVPNDSDENKAKNRRVELKIMYSENK